MGTRILRLLHSFRLRQGQSTTGGRKHLLPYETIMKGTVMKENELTYELICAAVKGDREALDQILIYYDDYINTLATVKAEDAQGNEYQYVDGDLKTRIQMKLVDAIPKWRGLRNVDDRFI